MRPRYYDQTLPHNVITLFSVIGLLMIFIYPISIEKYWAAVSTLIFMAFASFGTGGVVGFIFGIPRALQGGNSDLEKVRSRYAANTTLEQISDWLTKILVGVGLTQLLQLPATLDDLIVHLSGEFKLQFSKVFIGGLLIHFCICGFLFVYLWSRLHLIRDFTDAEDISGEDTIAELIARLDDLLPKANPDIRQDLVNTINQFQAKLAKYGENDPDSRLRELSSSFDVIRRELPGVARTQGMRKIMSEARAIAATNPQVRVDEFAGATPGNRIISLAIIRASPSTSFFEKLKGMVSHSTSGFEQYHALRAMEEVAANLRPDQKTELKSVIGEQQRGGEKRYLTAENPDRLEISNRILKILENG